ncbi:acyl carrier protein [Carbonactinospora thermoautotrophica]|uniref:Curamycin polyketide synthase acyl carrier protein n=1 Tax=Carbonactinospora thermoautotrophica TaxID=1469144 RepID=A0A132NFT6_9ACTN|nr:acyl carrier protein [Carbonactinospora thermoautotrophica]KWW98073.1 Curamycin polyketide synthase acyl carrier protein [Carbonactinospora thermoautotrophica]KWX02967.1 Phosphopantetheine-binding protein [Carbonactinospora thermoautotrophica]KWX08522.1 Curamycin polyketide synthase acyl carrier protein [Carbonactinospora thermoautotrophica]MCX9192636.1 acyl carrier protein [Carbonactinospora thermoautotrophica]
MSNGPLTFEELASVINSCAGVPVSGEELAGDPLRSFADLNVDSLGLLGIVAELERRYGIPLGTEAEQCASPHELLNFVNAQITSGV